MPTNRTRLRRQSKLLDYPKPWEERPVTEERWLRHRERMLATGHPGRRPPEWWRYHKKLPQPRDLGDEEIALFEMGELSEAEIAALMPGWRREFRRSMGKDFFYTDGPGRFLEGEQARKLHWRWAGIPAAVLERLAKEPHEPDGNEE